MTNEELKQPRVRDVVMIELRIKDWRTGNPEKNFAERVDQLMDRDPKAPKAVREVVLRGDTTGKCPRESILIYFDPFVRGRVVVLFHDVNWEVVHTTLASFGKFSHREKVG